MLRALDAAREGGLLTFGFTGATGGAMAERCDRLFRAPSSTTWIIQQVHITAAHMFCGMVERILFPAAALA